MTMMVILLYLQPHAWFVVYGTNLSLSSSLDISYKSNPIQVALVEIYQYQL